MQMQPSHAARDPEVVPDWETFKPERFLRENVRERKGCPMASKQDHRTTKDPFGMGARLCLGKRAAEMELRALLTQIFQRYKLVEERPGQTYGKKLETLQVPDPLPRINVVPRRQ